MYINVMELKFLFRFGLNSFRLRHMGIGSSDLCIGRNIRQKHKNVERTSLFLGFLKYLSLLAIVYTETH